MTKILKQTFNYTVPEGKEFINFDNWAGEYLEREEYNAWYHACKRQNEIINAQKENNKLVQKGDEYYWDENTVKYEQPCDPEWLQFWDRYLDETGIVFEAILEESGD